MAKTYMKLDGNLVPISLDTTISKEEETKTVTPNFASGNVVVTPTSGKVLSQVTVNKDTTNHVAGNIKKDVTLYGVTGTLESGGATPTKLATPVVSGDDKLATWSAIPNATSYDIVYKTDGANSIEIYNQITTSVNKSSNKYAFRVIAKADGFISSDLSNSWYIQCFIKGTQITLSNGTTKNVEDINYSNDLLVWDFDNSTFSNAKPLWILKPKTTNKYTKLTFDDGTTLSLVGPHGRVHRVFDYDRGYFEYGDHLPIGARTFNNKGEIITLINIEVIYEDVDFYNIITDYHMNLFSNTVLTSCGYNNMYPIENMKFVKDERKLIPIEDYNVDSKWYIGLRLGEQDLSLRSIKKAHTYIANLMEGEK